MATKKARRPPEQFARLASAIRAERDRLGRIAGEAQEAAGRFNTSSPTTFELRAIGAILHDFYTGAEKIFEEIAPELNGGLPAGPNWHRKLLENMTLELKRIRPAVLTETTARTLEEFLRFRHLVRNLYGFELDWPKVRDLLGRTPAAWTALAKDLNRFVAFLDTAAKG